MTAYPLPTVIFEKGERVHLRPITEADIPRYLVWMNDPEVRQFIARRLPVNEADERAFIKQPLGSTPSEIPFAIVESATDRHIGSAGLHHVDWITRKAELGILLGPREVRGQGYGTEAFQLLTRYAFEGLNLHRVYLTVFAFNTRAIRSYERQGFLHEGTDRDGVYVNGSHHDVHRYSLLAREWFGKGIGSDTSG